MVHLVCMLCCYFFLQILPLSITFTHPHNLKITRSSKGYRFKVAANPADLSASATLQQQTHFFNSLTRRKELFNPINPPFVSFYSCGPTVYDYAHIGNFRAFLTYDLIKRWLQYIGYKVEHICNLTDVDDKIIVKMTKEGKSLQEVTQFYTNAFFHDLQRLNIQPATKYPKATEYIQQMENMISTLMTKDHAYTSNGSVYYRVKSFQPKFGTLANYTDDQQLAEGAGGNGPNQRRGEDDKEDARDFALWKAHTPADGDVTWDTRLGKGRPGWHIECSAMCHSLLGDSIDIHGGGSDLMFPHHTNEILQTEAFTGKQFSRVWMHNGFVNINNEKMSKSLQNFKTLRDIAQSPFDARAIRFLILSVQYRNPINFNAETLSSAKNSLKRIDKVVSKLKTGKLFDIKTDIPRLKADIAVCTAEFEAGMADDLNTSRAFAALFKLVALAEKYTKDIDIDVLASSNQRSLLEDPAVNQTIDDGMQLLHNAFQQLDSVLGLFYDVPMELPKSNAMQGEDCTCCCPSNSDEIVDKSGDELVKIQELALKRMSLKQQKLFKEADLVRDEITQMGYGVKDKKDGFDIYRLDE